MISFLCRFLRDEDGATAAEYAVMAALIIVTVIGSITQFGGAGLAMFEGILTDLAATD